MGKLRNLLFLSLAFLEITSCDIINPEEAIPYYLKIDSIDVSAKTAEGTSSHKVTDAWVFINDDPIGAFELPALIPILDEGGNRLSVMGGIMDNGASGIRQIYPFYTTFDTVWILNPGKRDTIFPTVGYRSDVTFEINEDFESGTIFIKEKGDTDIVIVVDSSQVFEVGRSAAIFLDETKSSFVGISTPLYQLPGFSNPVYIELNYKTNNQFQVGLKVIPLNSTAFTSYRHTINTKATWNKIYLNLTEQVSGFNAQYGSVDYQVLIKAEKSTADSVAAIFLDNIKLIH